MIQYLILINVIAFVVYGVDKQKAKHHAWRIPEATLIGLAAIGGAVGAFFGMNFWHHKTKKIKFRILVPLLTILWAGVIWYILVR